ncbi:MAG: VWA domain-containing protein [Desulfurococcales archaeon]|nr:VWA domain-containing protein [Desulfurococcales archaeon]
MGKKEGPKRYSIIAGVGEIDGIRAYKGSKILSIAESIGGKRLDQSLFDVPLAVDIFYSFFLPVPAIDYSLVEGNNDEALLFRVSTLSALLSSRRFHRLKSLTTADSTTSVVASASFIERLARLMEHARAGSGRGKSREDSGESSTSSIVERALEQAEHDARVAKSIKSLIARTGAGNTSMLSYGDNPEEILRLARNTNVERILRIVMGVKFSLTSKSKLMKRHSRGWLGGIEYGSDLERLHYSQLALPEELFLAKLADSKLLLYEKALPAAKGPIYVLLDKSGSMIGEKIDWARAVAVALLQRSAMENRPFYARFFDSTVYPLMKVSKSTHPSEVLDVLKYLATVRAGGGTNITGALLAAIDDVVSASQREAVSDIVIITDGEDRIDVEQVMRSMSKARLNIISVMIQGHNNYLKRLSTRYMTVRKLGSESILEIVDFE